jgi:uncharacterized CHY-type Zn-finger protein
MSFPRCLLFWKHTQAIVQAPCCQRWFDCAECHDEVSDHPFRISTKLRLQCKSCTRIFQKDLTMITERDRKCEGCDKFWNQRGKSILIGFP